MKSIHSSIRVAAAAIAAVAAMAVPALSHAGSVTLNSAQVCIDAPNLSMDPAGNLTISCTAPTSGGTPPPIVAPNCTVASPTITVGGVATLSASCTGGVPTTFAWAAGSGSPAVPTGTLGGSISITFAAAGTYGYSLDA